MPGANRLVEQYRSQKPIDPEEPLIHGVAWDGDVLVVDPETIAEHRLRRKWFSASVSNAMEGCHAQWAAGQIIPSPVDPFLARDAGSFMHDIFEHMFTLPPEQRTRDTYRAGRDAFARDLFDDHATQARWAEYLDTISLGLWDLEDPAQVDVYATELGVFGLPLAGIGVPLIGFFDRVSIDGTDEHGHPQLSIDDYKSGKWSDERKLARYGDHYGDQIRLYVHAIRTILAERDTEAFRQAHADPREKWMFEIGDVVNGQLLYTMVGRKRYIDLSQKAIDTTVHTFAAHWDTHNVLADTGRYDTKTGPLCGWCPLVQVCPAAADAGKCASERATPPPSKIQLPIPRLRPRISASAHSPVQQTPKDKEPIMTDTAETKPTAVNTEPRHLHEGKPWDELSNNDLNIGSYAAGAVFGLVNRATALLRQSFPDATIKRGQIRQLAVLLAKIVQTGEKHITGHTDWQSQANTRVRGLLFTVLESTPVPSGGTVDDWKAWATRVRKNVIALIDQSIWLWDQTELPHVEFEALVPLARDTFDVAA